MQDEVLNPIQGPDGGKESHPRGLYLLFFTEMWERFSYYGMRALLMLYMISEISKGGLEWSTERAGQVYGLYTGLVYLTPLIGGLLADKILGFRRAVLIGGVLMALGHGALALESIPTFFLGLMLLIVGNGFFKPNISSMVGQLYPDGSPLKDSGYTIFYMGINIGAFLGTLICGWLGEKVGWHWGFGAAGIGMILGLLQFWIGQGVLGKVGLKPKGKSEYEQEIEDEKEFQQTATEGEKRVEKQRLAVIFVLAFFTIFFWLAFEQAGSSMNIFAYKYTDLSLTDDFAVPASWFQSVNAFLIFTLAPLFSWLWVALEKKKLNPSGPVKFAFGLVFLALGFVVLVIGGSSIPAGAETASVSMMWLTLAYLFHTIGELCLSPVGLSLVNKLSPKRLVGLMFGVWFGATALANYIGGAMAGMMDKISEDSSMSGFFLIFVISSGVAAVLLFVLSPWLKKMMHGVK